jgi:hypothetical protein
MRLADYIPCLDAGADAPTVQLDFDGTLAEGNGGNYNVLGKPIPSGVELARSLFKLGYRVMILTANPAPDVVAQWCVKHGVPFTAVTSQKMPAVAYVDDRAIPFHPMTPVQSIINRVRELTDG